MAWPAPSLPPMQRTGSGSTLWSRVTRKHLWSRRSRAMPDKRAAIVSRIPMGRAGRPEDVEGIMVYLASDESRYATGSLFRVDGGMTTL